MRVEDYLKKHLGLYNLEDEVNDRVLAAMKEYGDSVLGKVDRDKVIQMKNDGVSVVSIAKILGVSRQTIYNHLRKSPVVEKLDDEVEKPEALPHINNNEATDELPI